MRAVCSVAIASRSLYLWPLTQPLHVIAYHIPAVSTSTSPVPWPSLSANKKRGEFQNFLVLAHTQHHRRRRRRRGVDKLLYSMDYSRAPIG